MPGLLSSHGRETADRLPKRRRPLPPTNLANTLQREEPLPIGVERERQTSTTHTQVPSPQAEGG